MLKRHNSPTLNIPKLLPAISVLLCIMHENFCCSVCKISVVKSDVSLLLGRKMSFHNLHLNVFPKELETGFVAMSSNFLKICRKLLNH